MSPLLRFLVFIAIALGALGVGILVRRRGPLPVFARRVHLSTVVCTWTPLSFFSFWRLQIGPELAAGLVFQTILLLFGWFVGEGIARWRGHSPREVAVFGAAAALSNQGFTMGAFICYNLLPDGETARDYAIAYVTFLAVLVVVLVYPLVNSRAAAGSMKFGRLLRVSFLTPRAAPLYGASLGLFFNLFDLQAPVFDYNRLSLMLFNVGAAGAYLGIGLNLGPLRRGGRLDEMQWQLALVKFALVPFCAWLLLSLSEAIGWRLHPTFRAVILIEAVMPAAITSVVIAGFFHLDAERAARLWLGNTIVFLAGPLWVLIFVWN